MESRARAALRTLSETDGLTWCVEGGCVVGKDSDGLRSFVLYMGKSAALAVEARNALVPLLDSLDKAEAALKVLVDKASKVTERWYPQHADFDYDTCGSLYRKGKCDCDAKEDFEAKDALIAEIAEAKRLIS